MKSGLGAIIARLPADPGVYRFRDVQGRTLYIGRASVSRVRTKSCPMAFDLPCGRTAEFHAGGQVISGLG